VSPSISSSVKRSSGGAQIEGESDCVNGILGAPPVADAVVDVDGNIARLVEMRQW
jgi:hypothetical protein